MAPSLLIANPDGDDDSAYLSKDWSTNGIFETRQRGTMSIIAIVLTTMMCVISLTTIVLFCACCGNNNDENDVGVVRGWKSKKVKSPSIRRRRNERKSHEAFHVAVLNRSDREKSGDSLDDVGKDAGFLRKEFANRSPHPPPNDDPSDKHMAMLPSVDDDDKTNSFDRKRTKPKRDVGGKGESDSESIRKTHVMALALQDILDKGTKAPPSKPLNKPIDESDQPDRPQPFGSFGLARHMKFEETKRPLPVVVATNKPTGDLPHSKAPPLALTSTNNNTRAPPKSNPKMPTPMDKAVSGGDPGGFVRLKTSKMTPYGVDTGVPLQLQAASSRPSRQQPTRSTPVVPKNVKQKQQRAPTGPSPSGYPSVSAASFSGDTFPTSSAESAVRTQPGSPMSKLVDDRKSRAGNVASTLPMKKRMRSSANVKSATVKSSKPGGRK